MEMKKLQKFDLSLKYKKLKINLCHRRMIQKSLLSRQGCNKVTRLFIGDEEELLTNKNVSF